MKRLLPLFAVFIGLIIGLSACDKEPATVPGYLHIDEMKVEADYSLYGTSSSAITTVWVEIDGDLIGTFELPAIVPVAESGAHEVVLYPGITLNGINSLRNIYEFYTEYTETIVFEPNVDVWPNEAGDSIAVVDYNPASYYDYLPLEDFEGTALAFERSDRADTGIVFTSDPDYVFSDPSLSETSTKSGVGYMADADFLLEAHTTEEFLDLPKGGANVYLEMNYNTEAIITVGVYRRVPGSVDQVPVVSLFPSNEWKKIYINLVSEVSAVTNAEGFRIFVGGTNVEGNGEKVNLFDNFKLVY